MLKINIFFSALLIFTALFVFEACIESKYKNIPDVSGIDISLKINRFDQELFAIDTNEIESGIQLLEEKYPDFTDFYLQRVLQLKKPWDTIGAYRTYVNGFLTYPFVRDLHQKVDSVYNQFGDVVQELEQGFQFYKYYFPEKEVPDFFTFISEFTYGIVIPPRGNVMAIGLDFFLGKDYPYYYYPPLSLPKYVGRTQDKAHLPVKVFKGIIEDLVGPVPGNRFIDHIIHNGKKLYILDQLLPYHADSLKLQYTNSQVEWCKTNELEIWAYILKEEMMYSDDHQSFKSLVSMAPKSAGMPDESPGEVGNWMGLQIVSAYMNRMPQLSLQELISITEPQEILVKSKYKPSRF